jgi:hypothetical protein
MARIRSSLDAVLLSLPNIGSELHDSQFRSERSVLNARQRSLLERRIEDAFSFAIIFIFIHQAFEIRAAERAPDRWEAVPNLIFY